METLEALALAAIMSLLKDLDTYEELEKTVKEMEITWVSEKMIEDKWSEQQIKKKQTAFRQVHRQLVSRSSLTIIIE